MSIKLVILDMAGTTIRDENVVRDSFITAFRNSGVRVTPEEVDPLMGYHKPAAIHSLLSKHNLENDKIIAGLVYQDFQEIMHRFYSTDSRVQPMAEAEMVLIELKKSGKKVALNTGFPRKIAQAILDRVGWFDKNMVDDLIASDEVPQGRPEPYMIHHLMRNAGVTDPSEVAKVGDTPVDIEEGKRAGCRFVIGVTTGPFNAEELVQYKPTHLLHSLFALPVIVGG